jgi:hypothetical protein
MIMEPNQRQRSYGAFLSGHRETVFWRRSPDREIWELEAAEDEAPDASNWFFVVNHPRTGSSVTADLLNAHPRIYCGMEEHILPLFMAVLGSEMLIAPHLQHAVRYTKNTAISPRRMRHLLEGWRRGTSERPVFGDKGDMYYTHFGEACSRVFPGCKLILTVRDPLDTLSSYLQQPWASYLYKLYPEPADLYQTLRSRVFSMLELNRVWRERAEVIVFEDMVVPERFIETFQRIFRHLQVEAEEFDWEAGWKRCTHSTAIGRWRQDPRIASFLEWLLQEDPALREILLSGDRFLPEGAYRARPVALLS